MISLIFLFTGILLSIKKSNFRVGFDAVLFFGLFYLIYVGLRDINFGEDSINYYNNYFLNSHQFGSILEFLSSNDIFFRFINYLLLLFSNNWNFFSFSIACIFIYLLIKIDNFSEKKEFLFTALILSSPVFVENSTNIIRTTMCCLILMIGYLGYQNKKKYMLIIIFGFLTHLLQSIILFSLFLGSKFVILIKNNKSKNIFTILLLIVLSFKTFSSILTLEFLNEYFEIINLFLTENEIQYYTLKQIISEKNRIPINIFFQLLIYIIIPLFLIKLDVLKSYQKKLLNIVFLSLLTYAFLFPQITFALRLIPFCVLGLTFIFATQMNKYNKIYCILILFFNAVLVYNNINYANFIY